MTTTDDILNIAVLGLTIGVASKAIQGINLGIKPMPRRKGGKKKKGGGFFN